MQRVSLLLGTTITAALLACACGGGGGDDSSADAEVACPSGMTYATGATACIDKYEASEGSAGEAVSAANASPWVSLTQAEATVGCDNAGKRLCTRDEWEAACQGSAGAEYPYGDTYDDDACNGTDFGAGEARPTGFMADCEGGYTGLFDMSGNVSEWTATCSGTNCRHNGGAFTSQESALDCTSGSTVPASSTGQVLGFRCCKD